MKKNIFYFILIAFGQTFAQHKQFERVHELGFGVGGLNYTGDLAENLRLKYTKPAVNAFYRYNFRDEVSVIRVNARVGKLGVDESKSPEALRKFRSASFSGTLIELSLLYEYDFFDFRDIDNKYYMSPFLYGGISANTFITSPNSVPAFVGIPFGAGVKFRLNGNWNLGLEFGASKNFTDSIDNQVDEKAFGTSILTDWHYQAGINLSYTFYNLICPEDVSKKVKRK